MLDTLGEVVTVALAIIAVLVVPAAIARAWWPEVKRTIGAVVDLFVMSPQPERTPVRSDTVAVHVPVPRTDTSTDTTAEQPDITPIGLTTKPSRREVIITLAMLRGPDNKHMFSANQIYDLVKGPRAEVLAQIKEVREGPQPIEYVGERYAQVEQQARELVTNGKH